MSEQHVDRSIRLAGVNKAGAVLRFTLVVACLSLSLILFIRHAWSLSHRRNALDRLGIGLNDVRALVPEGNLIGFASDATGDEQKELMHRAQFLLAPRVVDRTAGTADTILVINGDQWLAAQPGLLVLVDERAGPDHIMLVSKRASR